MYCVGYADYIFITEEGIECKIQQEQSGEYILIFQCLERHHIDPGQQTELKCDLFSSLDDIEKLLEKNSYRIEWQERDYFSHNALKYNTMGKVMSGSYRGCECMIEDNRDGTYSLFIYGNEENNCNDVIFFDDLEHLKKSLNFIVEFPVNS